MERKTFNYFCCRYKNGKAISGKILTVIFSYFKPHSLQQPDLKPEAELQLSLTYNF